MRNGSVFWTTAAGVTLAAVALAGETPAPPPTATQEEPGRIHGIEEMITVGRAARMKVVVRYGEREETVVTTFRANRVGADMRYRKGEEYGRAPNADHGLYHRRKRIAEDEHGVLRVVRPGETAPDPLEMVSNIAVDPLGRVTFYYAYIRRPGDPVARRTYLWGYPPGTERMTGMIGGPRSPVAPRRPLSPPVQKDGPSFRFELRADKRNRCNVYVFVERDGDVDLATTFFRANRLGEDMRYFPSELSGGTDKLVDGVTYCADLEVVQMPDGGLRSPRPGEAGTETLVATLSLDDRGHVTFFYGFIPSPDDDRVQRFLLWGHTPETIMVDDLDEADPAGDENPDRRI